MHAVRVSVTGRIRKAALLVVLALGLTGGAALAVPAAAIAATYNNECGAGYKVIDSVALKGGKVFLTYSQSTGENCVATIRDSGSVPGTISAQVKRSTRAGFPRSGSTGATGGLNPQIAPVARARVTAPRSCIDWGGGIGDSRVQAYSVHCG
ncbi:Spore-associated protein A [Frankia sp. AiPs1]